VRALCLRDDVAGRLTHWVKRSAVSKLFSTQQQFGEGGCGPIRKEGTFTAANGDQLEVEAEGTFCFGTQVATYEFRVTEGTGRFVGASGSGSWFVPPPATFDGVDGTEDEFLNGLLVR
jgi:hypothetical protein